MKRTISEEQFLDLVGLYLDNEATEADLANLALCLRKDKVYARIFVQHCRVHAASCKLYGKTASFKKIDGVDFARLLSRPVHNCKRAVVEWSAAAALMMLASFLYTTASSQYQNSTRADKVEDSTNKIELFDVTVAKPTDNSKTEYSVIQLAPKKLTILAD